MCKERKTKINWRGVEESETGRVGVKDIAVQLGQLSVIRARHDNIWVIHCQTGQQVAAVTRGLTQQCGGGVGQHHHWHSLRFADPKRVAETGAEDRFAVENMLKHSH